MVLQLRFDDFLRLRRSRGAAIEVLEGKVWITEPGCAEDLFLEPGRRHRVGSQGLVLVGAEHSARVLIERRCGAQSFFRR